MSLSAPVDTTPLRPAAVPIPPSESVVACEYCFFSIYSTTHLPFVDAISEPEAQRNRIF